MDKDAKNKILIAIIGLIATVIVPLTINSFLNLGRTESQTLSMVRENTYQLRELIRDNQAYYDEKLTFLLQKMNKLEKKNEIVLDRYQNIDLDCKKKN